jgi:hypothetical protein
MIDCMRTHRGLRTWLATLACVVALAGVPCGAGGLGTRTAGAQELEIEHDARLEGYTDKMVLDTGNNAMLWLGFGVLAAVTLLGLFKDAKRSHLD